MSYEERKEYFKRYEDRIGVCTTDRIGGGASCQVYYKQEDNFVYKLCLKGNQHNNLDSFFEKVFKVKFEDNDIRFAETLSYEDIDDKFFYYTQIKMKPSKFSSKEEFDDFHKEKIYAKGFVGLIISMLKYDFYESDLGYQNISLHKDRKFYFFDYHNSYPLDYFFQHVQGFNGEFGAVKLLFCVLVDKFGINHEDFFEGAFPSSINLEKWNYGLGYVPTEVHEGIKNLHLLHKRRNLEETIDRLYRIKEML